MWRNAIKSRLIFISLPGSKTIPLQKYYLLVYFFSGAETWLSILGWIWLKMFLTQMLMQFFSGLSIRNGPSYMALKMPESCKCSRERERKHEIGCLWSYENKRQSRAITNYDANYNWHVENMQIERGKILEGFSRCPRAAVNAEGLKCSSQGSHFPLTNYGYLI